MALRAVTDIVFSVSSGREPDSRVKKRSKLMAT
jgi:hypothetical protein